MGNLEGHVVSLVGEAPVSGAVALCESVVIEDEFDVIGHELVVPNSHVTSG